VGLVVAFNLIMLALLEIPLLGFAIAPAWTVATIERTKVWMSRNGRRSAAMALSAIGTLLVIKTVIEFVS
jgi:Sap-like sulfolipid-1-addressing protein